MRVFIMPYSIAEGIEILNLCLYLPTENTLALADLHLGFEEMMNKQGTLMPRLNFAEIKKRLERVFIVLEQRGAGKLEKIIINGDLKHEFGTISEQEWMEVLDIIELLQRKCGKIILVQGNHDNILGPIAHSREVEIEKFHYLAGSKIIFTHGHQFIGAKEFNEARTVIIGHEHPAVKITEGAKGETYKCFLKGVFEGKELIVMPSMNQVHIGTNMAKGKVLSPFLQGNLAQFDVWVCEEGETYHFGKLGKLE